MAVGTVLSVALAVLVVFLPAGSFAYWQGWVALATLMGTTLASVSYLYVTDRAALARRFQVGREHRPVQRVAAAGLFLTFVGLAVFSAFDHRFDWSPVPTAVSLAGDALVATGVVLITIVNLQNRYAAGNIGVEEGQQVVTTGLYRFVRHPMYSSALILVGGVPLALGSWWGSPSSSRFCSCWCCVFWTRRRCWRRSWTAIART